MIPTPLAVIQQEITATEKRLAALRSALAVLGGDEVKHRPSLTGPVSPAQKKRKRQQYLPRRATIAATLGKLSSPMPKANFLAQLVGRSGKAEKNRWTVAMYKAIADGHLVCQDGLIIPPKLLTTAP